MSILHRRKAVRERIQQRLDKTKKRIRKKLDNTIPGWDVLRSMSRDDLELIAQQYKIKIKNKSTRELRSALNNLRKKRAK